jgi:hypothetical protein
MSWLPATFVERSSWTSLAQLTLQRGFDSLEAAYHHFVHESDNGDEDYQTACLNIEFERLRLAAIAGGQEVYDAILRICATSRPRVSTNRTKLDPCGLLALRYHVTI